MPNTIGFRCRGCLKQFDVYVVGWRRRWRGYLGWWWHRLRCKKKSN